MTESELAPLAAALARLLASDYRRRALASASYERRPTARQEAPAEARERPRPEERTYVGAATL